MNLYIRLLRKYIEIHRKSKTLRRVWFCLAAFVVFVTVYQLIIPSITLTKKNADSMAGISTDDDKRMVLDCGLKVHHHDKSCYRKINGEKTLVCGYADYVIHEHDYSCYAVNDKGKRVLVCELPEIKAHQHDDTCYEEETILVCEKEESEGHEHTDDCYETEKDLICDQEEHLHDEDCYTEIEDEAGEVTRELTCDKTEHEHDDDCYKTVKKLICGQKEEKGHTHSDECYETRKVLTCSESEPHEHTRRCYEKGHNGDPDYLICGKLELKSHQHSKECFDIVLTDETDESDEKNSEERETEAAEIAPGAEADIDTETEKDFSDEESLTEESSEGRNNSEEKETGSDESDSEGSSEVSESDSDGEIEETKDSEAEQPSEEEGSDQEEDAETIVKEITFSKLLTNDTGIWRRTEEDGWSRVGSTTRLTRNENLMVRIAYLIPKGTLHSDHADVVYALPENLGATQRTADRINDDDNHLNQILEGTRLPDEEKDGRENLAGKYEMTTVSGHDEEEESEHFQLELHFNSYTVQENASHDVEGWLMFYLKDIALDHGEDGTGRIVFSRNTLNEEKDISVSYVVADETAEADEAAETEETESAEEESQEENPADDPVRGITYPALSFEGTTSNLIVNVQAEEGAFPLGTTMTVEEVDDEDTLDSIREAASDEKFVNKVRYVRAVDITFTDKNGQEIEPLKPIRVSITCPEKKKSEDAFVMHVDHEGDIRRVDQDDEDKSAKNPADNEIIFDADSFSIYAFVGTDTIEKNILASDGNNYRVTVTYGADADVPAGAELDVTELTESSDLYEEYVTKTEAALGQMEEKMASVRLFDIRIVDTKGKKVEISAPVDVKIELTDKTDRKEDTGTQIVHFPDHSAKGEVVENVDFIPSEAEEGVALSFEASGFSVYAVVNLQDLIDPNSIIDDTTALDTAVSENKSFNLYVRKSDGNNYFKAVLNSKGAYTVSLSLQDAAEWTFEKAEGDSCYYIKNASAGYMKQTSGSDGKEMGFADNVEEASVFEISQAKNGRFYFKLKNEEKWLQYSGSGSGIRLYTDNKNDENSQIGIINASVESDPNGLDNKSFGMMVWAGGTTAKAMMASEDTTDHTLGAMVLNVMTQEHQHNNKLYVPNDTADQITEWTFHWMGSNTYKLSAEVKTGDSDVTTKYLTINANGLSLTENEGDASIIEVTTGTGSYANQVCLKCGSRTLTYSGTLENGYGISGRAGNEWLYLTSKNKPDPETIPDGYYRTYAAEKISVSDPSLSTGDTNVAGTPIDELTGKTIIIYTRSWNRQMHRYDYFAVDGEGKLVPCHESGDMIEWVGSNLDSIQWKLVEYTDKNGKITDYYELYNESTGKYIAPSIGHNVPLSDNPVGLVLSGRHNGQYYSPILAWDESSYSYAGLKVNRTANTGANDDYVASSRRTNADDFYFAIVQESNVDDQIHPVRTVDNTQYGITMKLVNLENKNGTLNGDMNKFLGSYEGGMTNKTIPGLLSTKLDSNGYPSTMLQNTGGNLSGLFNGAQDANHLFIESTYLATGYYEYNSAQNYATILKEDGTPGPDFTVYKELGSYDSGGNKYTLKHGQFYPYNDLQAGVFADPAKNGQNLYEPRADSHGNGIPLSEDDPRKYEQLYLVGGDGNPDYYFGMELGAEFEQTPNGLDAWDHDIIFEFSGDDDFWLYVDGELVIDLGGIHSAVPGSVNFRTGDVNVNGTQTTLLDLFIKNRVGRGEYANEAAARAALLDPQNGIFTEKYVDGEPDPCHVFKDNTPHNMRIFYLERGAGASNLHMRFNLAAVKKGTVQLKKELENVSDSAYAEFPYQIYYRYRDKNDNIYGEENDPDNPGKWALLKNSTFRPNSPYYQAGGGQNHDPGNGYPHLDGNYTDDYVFYKGSNNPVKFDPYLKIGSQVYHDVFFLTASSPTNCAEISFPPRYLQNDPDTELEVEYYIVECGIDPSSFTEVYANGTRITGTAAPDDAALEDYKVAEKKISERSSVTYLNKAADPGSLTFTKNLYDAAGHQIKNDPDDPRFDFRLYFGASFDAGPDTAAYMYVYHVKDENGNYCKWVEETGSTPGHFETLKNAAHYPNGTNNLDLLTRDTYNANGEIVQYGDRTLASFDSSTNGAISKIPPYYTVEVLDLIPGTQYRVVERPTETPDGYHLWRYKVDGAYVNNNEYVGGISDDDYAWKGVQGRITAVDNSTVIVDNKKGYGLRLNKNWGDADTLKWRQETYFGVYKKTDTYPGIELIPGSVKRLVYAADATETVQDKQTLSWYYPSLPDNVNNIDELLVYEVVLSGYAGTVTVDKDGFVTNFSGTITPVGNETSDPPAGYTPEEYIPERPGLGDDGLTLEGTLKSNSSKKDVYYEVIYDHKRAEGSNVRIFDAENTPINVPALKLVKTDWNGEPLAGAVFELRDITHNENDGILIGTYTSASTGLIKLCYLDYGHTYTLKEKQSPNGYIGLPEILTIHIGDEASDGHVTVEPAPGNISNYYSFEQKNEQTKTPATITIKDRHYQFKVLKIDDSVTPSTPLQGAVFKLYKAVKAASSGTVQYDPMPGYEQLTTGGNGYLAGLPDPLGPGSYALQETASPYGYGKMSEWIYFTVSTTGVIELGNHPDGVEIQFSEDADNKDLIIVITAPNTPIPIKLRKVDDAGTDLPGAEFILERKTVQAASEVPEEHEGDDPSEGQGDAGNRPWENVKTIDMTSVAETDLPILPPGEYRLKESKVPHGFVVVNEYIYFKVNNDRTVKLTDAEGNISNTDSVPPATISRDNTTQIYTITIENTPGAALPHTGGPGTGVSGLLGAMLIALAAAGMLMVRKREISI